MKALGCGLGAYGFHDVEVARDDDSGEPSLVVKGKAAVLADERGLTNVAAARELIEETGYRAKRFRVFLDVFPTPGFLEERMFILLAEELTVGEAEPEEDEKIISRAYSRKQLDAMIGDGKLRDAKSIAGILYYFRYLAPQGRVKKS